ncbi:carboxymuconolactone decarboxylase family protein [Antribacter gilvus]|uniref:carboxymuconolactone decarboxylase family protein n=1 Tax=Antribacter gilvus TaxID=2304675 RepID=UPI0013E0970B|nr:carboxymuconolactone decarboxylase family protein [Antribacter gilvus]
MTENLRHEESFRKASVEHGLEVIDRIGSPGVRNLVSALDGVAPELGYQILAWGYGELYESEHVTPRDRQLVTIGILGAMGGCEPELRLHLDTALNVGVTKEQIAEIVVQVAGYAGIPRAVNMAMVAKEIYAARDAAAAG